MCLWTSTQQVQKIPDYFPLFQPTIQAALKEVRVKVHIARMIYSSLMVHMGTFYLELDLLRPILMSKKKVSKSSKESPW